MFKDGTIDIGGNLKTLTAHYFAWFAGDSCSDMGQLLAAGEEARRFSSTATISNCIVAILV